MMNKKKLILTFAIMCCGIATWLVYNAYFIAPPTFAKDIAPIVYENCTPCHRPGEAGPFTFITYADVKRKAGMIKEVTTSRFMPPWPADPSYSHFADERYLTSEQIKMIGRWVDNGCPMGDSTRLPASPHFPTGSMLGKPDLVIKMPNHFLIKGDNTDKFLVMKLPYQIPRDTFVKMIEFVPGNRKLLHHMNGHLIQYAFDKKSAQSTTDWAIDQAESEDSRVNHRRLGLLNDDGSYPLMRPSVVNYLPGVISSVFPNGIGGFAFTRKGAIYINNMHYGPTPIDQSDSSYFNVFYAPAAPKRPVGEFILGTLGISAISPPLEIPANAQKKFYTELTIQKDISLLSINPHMHLIGKTFKAYAVKPSGDTLPLIRINNWDFRWQYFYKFKAMLKLERGTKICVEALFDNTSNNPNNPNNPPKHIHGQTGSMRTTDEMLQLICSYVAYQQGDENISLEQTPIK